MPFKNDSLNLIGERSFYDLATIDKDSSQEKKSSPANNSFLNLGNIRKRIPDANDCKFLNEKENMKKVKTIDNFQSSFVI